MPFNGECLHLNDYLPLPRLRSLVIAIVDILRDNYAAMPIYQFDDWHEHDGYVTQRSTVDCDAVDKVLVDDDSLYAARHGDVDVRRAYYPEDYSFLLRFYILDTDSESEYPGIWGDCDVCASPSLIRIIKAAVPESLAPQLVTTNAKDYFDELYAG